MFMTLSRVSGWADRCVHEQRQRVPRNHQLFVGRHDIDRNAAVGARYLQRVPGVRVGIERDAEPSEPLGNARADAGRVFADAGGEDEGVEALQGGRQHSGVERRRGRRNSRPRMPRADPARLELAHVVADAGQALQAAIAVKEILHVRCRHALFRDEIEHDAGIELAWPRSHRQARRAR